MCQVFSSLQGIGGSLEITLTVPLKVLPKFPYAAPPVRFILFSFSYNICIKFVVFIDGACRLFIQSPNLAIRTFCKHTHGERRPLSAKTKRKHSKVRLCADTYTLVDI